MFVFLLLSVYSDDDSRFNDKNMTKHTIPGQSLKKCFHFVKLCVCSVLFCSKWYFCDMMVSSHGSVPVQPLAWWFCSKRKLTTDSICTNVSLILQKLEANVGHSVWQWSNYCSCYFKTHWDSHGSSLQAVIGTVSCIVKRSVFFCHYSTTTK